MTIKTCPIEGYQDFTIEYPDELRVRHQRIFATAVSEAIDQAGGPDNIMLQAARFYGCKALCSRFENAPTVDLDDWPLAVFNWFLDVLYFSYYEPAVTPPKN